ncbi:MAG: extracellular solute-binding protein [Caldilineaceae bacterium]|nr:extracellular solute-binding protein [Caldilineaceae bacterium]
MKDRTLSRRAFLQATAALGLGVAGSSFLAACAPSSGSSGSGSSGLSSEVIEIRVQNPGIPHLTKTNEWAIERFNEENTDIQAISEVTPYNEIVKKTEVGFASGTLQDCVYGHNKWYKFNAYRGIYAPVDELIDSDPPDDFEDFFAQGVEGLRWEGTLYCLPDIIKPGPANLLFYNKTILNEKGIDEPDDTWTMLDLESAARAATDPDNGVFGFDCPWDSDLHRLACFTRAFGDPTLADKRGWPISEDGTQFRLLEPLVADTAQWFVNMLQDRVMPRGGDDVEGGNFQAGILAFEISAIGFPATYREAIGDRFEWGYMVQPPGPDGRRGTCMEGNQWMLNSKSEHIDAAWQVLKRLTDKDSNIYGATVGKIPARRSAYLDEALNAEIPTYAQFVPIMDEFLEPFPMVSNLRYNEVFQVYQQEIAFIVNGEMSWDEYAPTVYEKVQAVVDEARPKQALS